MTDLALFSPLEQRDIREAVQILSVSMLNVPLDLDDFQGRKEEAHQELERMSDEVLAKLD